MGGLDDATPPHVESTVAVNKWHRCHDRAPLLFLHAISRMLMGCVGLDDVSKGLEVRWIEFKINVSRSLFVVHRFPSSFKGHDVRMTAATEHSLDGKNPITVTVACRSVAMTIECTQCPLAA